MFIQWSYPIITGLLKTSLIDLYLHMLSIPFKSMGKWWKNHFREPLQTFCIFETLIQLFTFPRFLIHRFGIPIFFLYPHGHITIMHLQDPISFLLFWAPYSVTYTPIQKTYSLFNTKMSEILPSSCKNA